MEYDINNIDKFIIENKIAFIIISDQLIINSEIDVFIKTYYKNKYKKTRILTDQNMIINLTDMFIDLNIPFILQGFYYHAFIFSNKKISKLDNLDYDTIECSDIMNLKGNENELLSNSFMKYKLLWNI